MKKVILIAIGLLVLLAIVLAIYVFGIKDRAVPENEASDGETSVEEVTTYENAGPLAQLTNYQVAGYRVLKNSVAVVGNDGVVEELDFTGNPVRELGIINLKGIVRAEIDPTASTTALLWMDQKTQEGRWYLWKTESGVLEMLPATVREVSFSPAGKILRQEENEGKTTLIVVSGGRSTTVLTSQIPDLVASWVDEERIALLTRPSGLAPGILYLFNTRTRATSRILGGRFGLSARTSPGGEWALFSETGQDGKGIQLKSVRGGSERALHATTLPERCLFVREGRAICSIFDTNVSGKVMPDEYLRGDFVNVSSDLMEIEFATGAERALAQNIPQDAATLQLSKDSNVLFFINKKDGALWRLVLY